MFFPTHTYARQTELNSPGRMERGQDERGLQFPVQRTHMTPENAIHSGQWMRFNVSRPII